MPPPDPLPGTAYGLSRSRWCWVDRKRECKPVDTALAALGRQAQHSSRAIPGGQLPTSSPPPPPRALGVAVPSPLRRLFDYRPAGTPPPGGWTPGLRVRVSFGRREVVGVVVECRDHSELPLAEQIGRAH